jgi:hypothetical protein
MALHQVNLKLWQLVVRKFKVVLNLVVKMEVGGLALVQV